DVFEYMYQLSKTAPFGIKTTEAMHYRRYVAQRIRAEHGATENEAAKGVAFRTAGVSDGKGFVFVSHQGEIFPSGFLPVSGGNVLIQSLTDVYRNSELFKTLRDTTQREGKCGICEYQKICGGSRARAYDLTGDYLAEDPRCTYQPHLAEALAGGRGEVDFLVQIGEREMHSDGLQVERVFQAAGESEQPAAIGLAGIQLGAHALRG